MAARMIGRLHNCMDGLPPPSDAIARTVWKCDCGARWTCVPSVDLSDPGRYPERKPRKREVIRFPPNWERIPAHQRVDLENPKFALSAATPKENTP